MTTRLLCLVLLCLAALGRARPAPHPALAAPASVTLHVNSTLDQIDVSPGDGNCKTASATCTLRAAVMEADQAVAANVTIMLPAGTYTLTIRPAGPDDGSTGDLHLAAPTSGITVINLAGAGAATTIIDASAISDRVLTVAAGRTAGISDLTLRGGSVSAISGGGILNHGTLTVDHSTVSGNQAADLGGEGGGLFNDGQLTVVDSTIGPNNTARFGGGLSNRNTLTLLRSTVYGNGGLYGAGLYNGSDSGNSLEIINSTLSQNVAATTGGYGGAIYNDGTANVYNATIVFNSADTDPNLSTAPGGVYNGSSATFNLRNTLLAGNYHANDSSAADCRGTLNAYGRNLFGLPPAECTVVTGSGTWGIVFALNKIGPLQDNGGPTWTDALLPGSSGIDWGDPVDGCVGPSGTLTTDQRGLPRVVGASCDIGAFEFLPPAAFLPVIRQ